MTPRWVPAPIPARPALACLAGPLAMLVLLGLLAAATLLLSHMAGNRLGVFVRKDHKCFGGPSQLGLRPVSRAQAACGKTG